MKNITLISKQEIKDYLIGRFTNVDDLVLVDIKKDQAFAVHRVFEIRGVSFQVCTYEVSPDEFQRVLIVGQSEVYEF